MTFGAVIATGTGNALLSAPLAECLIEVRIEQTLDEPARFGIRVREDISEGEPMAARSAELRAEQIITIAVPREDGLLCLVRGPITESQSQYTLGGPGSWYEVHGVDRRMEMGRQAVQVAWEGRASDAARSIASTNGFTPDVQDTDRIYARATETLNQRGTDLDFLKTIAREHGFFFWLSYEAQTAASALTVVETAHFKTSPFRALGPGGVPPSITDLVLAPTATPRIRAGAGDECANNVTAFSVREDVERPNAANVSAVDTGSVNRDQTSTSDPEGPLGEGGQTLTAVSGTPRTLSVTAAGNAEQVRGRAEAALADSGWFITATASTTAHMLGGIVQPHDVIEVDAVGSRHSGPYRVKKVTHVITPADHHMDIEMQSKDHREQ
jgi:hypothetical protein